MFAQPAADGNGGADDGAPEPERAWDGRLRLNTKVTRIERGAHGGVLVTTDDGQQRGAALVLLAVSAGVLQSEQICFAPELPLAKLAALHEVRMGGATKVFLAFPSKFWPEEQAHILIAHPRRGYYAVVSHLGAGAGAGRYPPAGAHILCVTVTGAEARRVDALSDDEVVDEIGELFALVWGEAPVPPPLEARVCRWGSDPLFMGAYAVTHSSSSPRKRRPSSRARALTRHCRARACPAAPAPGGPSARPALRAWRAAGAGRARPLCRRCLPRALRGLGARRLPLGQGGGLGDRGRARERAARAHGHLALPEPRRRPVRVAAGCARARAVRRLVAVRQVGRREQLAGEQHDAEERPPLPVGPQPARRPRLALLSGHADGRAGAQPY